MFDRIAEAFTTPKLLRSFADDAIITVTLIVGLGAAVACLWAAASVEGWMKRLAEWCRGR